MANNNVICNYAVANVYNANHSTPVPFYEYKTALTAIIYDIEDDIRRPLTRLRPDSRNSNR